MVVEDRDRFFVDFFVDGQERDAVGRAFRVELGVDFSGFGLAFERDGVADHVVCREVVGRDLCAQFFRQLEVRERFGGLENDCLHACVFAFGDEDLRGASACRTLTNHIFEETESVESEFEDPKAEEPNSGDSKFEQTSSRDRGRTYCLVKLESIGGVKLECVAINTITNLLGLLGIAFILDFDRNWSLTVAIHTSVRRVVDFLLTRRNWLGRRLLWSRLRRRLLRTGAGRSSRSFGVSLDGCWLSLRRLSRWRRSLSFLQNISTVVGKKAELRSLTYLSAFRRHLG